VTIVCLVATPAAWVIARRRVPGWLVISLYFLATTTVSCADVHLSAVLSFRKPRVDQQSFRVMFVYAAIYTPFSLFLLRTYIVSIPIELERRPGSTAPAPFRSLCGSFFR